VTCVTLEVRPPSHAQGAHEHGASLTCATDTVVPTCHDRVVRSFTEVVGGPRIATGEVDEVAEKKIQPKAPEAAAAAETSAARVEKKTSLKKKLAHKKSLRRKPGK
jgi:hypothetical protein